MSSFDIEVPKPFHKFEGEWRIHEQNLQVQALHQSSGDVRRVLSKNDLKRHKKALKSLLELISEHGVDELLDQYAALKADWQAVMAARYAALKVVETGTPAQEREARASLAILRENAKSIMQDKRALNDLLKPYRRYIQMRNRISSRIDEHEAAMKDKAINDENRRLMHLEANTIADAVISTLNGLDFCFRTTIRRGNTVKERVVSVDFSRVVVTPDTIQMKVRAGSRGLFGGFVSHLPRGVNIIQAFKNSNVLAQVSTSIEMPVTCPQVETGNWHEGTWIFVQRNGLVDGLPKHVSFADYIQRYPNEHRERIPIPAGLREGMWVNWAYLTEQPHLLITGQTGSGKTNALLSIISTLITKHAPSEMQLIFTDLKEGVDLHMFKDTPHSLGFIEDIPTLADAMIHIEDMRAQRMNEFKRADLRNIVTFNRTHPDHLMPHIGFVIDEFGALAARSHKRDAAIVYDLAEQLAMKARAAGIHLVLGVQTPRKEHIPPNLRDNITLKYAGGAANVHASIAAIGSGDAANLPKHPGRFLCKSGSDMYQVQMPEIRDSEVVDAIRTANAYERVELVDVLAVRDDAAPPPIVIKKEFGIEDFIRVVIDHLGGIINYRQVHEIVKDEYELSRNRAKAIADRIKAMKEVDYKGKSYEIAPSGSGKGGKQLIESFPIPG